MSKYIGARKFALGNGFKSFREMLNYAELIDHKNPAEHAAYIEWVDNDLSKAGIKALTRGRRVKSSKLSAVANLLEYPEKPDDEIPI